MIARIKGLKISQASERTAVTGQEMIPFQDGERNGKIRMIEFKDMTMYIFDPTIVDGKVSQEDYDALKQAIEEGKLIYTINSNRNGLDLATEVAIVGGTIYIESPDFIKEEGTDNISQVVFDTITVDGSLNYSKEQYTTTVIKTTGDGTKVLTDNGQYVYIGNLALTNIKFKDGTNTSTYDLVTNGITFRQNSTPCVSWNTIKSGNNIYMDIRIANATASMDGLMSKEDYVELNTTIPGQIEDLKEADSNINNRIDDLDDKIDKEIADREAEIDRIENKFDGVTDKLEDALQKEIEDRKAGDTTITNSLNAFISTKGQPGGLAELDSTGKVPAAQLPSYVDDVLEFSTKAQFPQTGETGKIYVAKDTNLTYRWTGTQYLEISQSLALGETPSTAYPGDKGKANRDALNSMPTKLTSYLTPTTSTGELVKINYKYAAKDGLNYGPLQDDNIDIPSATTTNAGAMSAIDKGRLDDLYNEFGSIQNPGDKLDSLPKNLVTGVDATSRNATSVTINYKQSDLSTASNSYANPITKSQTIPSANQTQAGVMTASDKQNLDVNIPNRITNLDNKVTTEVDRLEQLIESSSSEITNDLNVEIQARKDGDAQLQTNINNLQSTMNTELAKKVGKVTVAGSGNAVTTASISGDTLTLTKGATYNNYVHPAGSAPSKASGFYKFSTDSTSHVASVTAVTKSDITALGVPAQDTNTTYTFANGSAGNFTVTPSGGSAQTVSVGKPANAGNADTVGGISPSAFVKKAGDTMTGALTINQTSSVTPLTLHGTDVSSYIQFINSGTQTAEVGYTNSLGAYLCNDKLSTHPCISLGRVDSLDEGATFYYGGTHYKLLHKGNYANELDQRYSPKMVYNYDKGCLVKLRNASSVDAMITVRIFGNSYYTTPPFDTVIQFYNYNTGNSIIQYSGVNNGAGFGDIKVFIHDGKVHLWFKQIRQFQSFVVHAYYSNSSDYRNMVESISNAAMPTSGVARMVTITPKQSIYAGDDIISAAGGINIEHTNEINSYTNHLYLNHRYSSTGASTKNILMCANGGSVIVGVNAGSIAGDNKLYIGGNVASSGKVSAAGGFFKESDARLKSDIKPLDYTLDQICSIPTVSFIMNDQKQIGTIAQNLEELGFEDIVTESDTLKSEVSNPEQFESFTKDGEEYVKVKKVEYEMLGVLAIEGVKMLKDEIEKLKAEIETLKNKQHE
ncbi:hypothetical protein [uncultured phage cr150_1]|uniref:Peptidase S74 domain-containing protein n=2 Tax=root TaxID=1 RepID=A0AA48WZZ6_9CAUD|nr:hypothetical protein [uncultured phage cr150_1]